MTPAIALWLLVFSGFVLVGLFVFTLYRIGKALFSEEQMFLSEMVLAILFTGLCTAAASQAIYASAVFHYPEFVVVLFMFFFMLSVLAGTAYALGNMKALKIADARLRIVNLLMMWTVACLPWIFILHAVTRPD